MRFYMKKVYQEPMAEIEKFNIADTIATSTQDDSEGHIDQVIEEPDAVVHDSDTGEIKAYMDENGNSYTPEDKNSIF